MKDELVFKSKISKMGNNRIIWIPLALREMIRDYEDEDIIVTIKKQKVR
jgi:antitoxin component of MazEF toxin-antitoxin module